MKKSAPLAAAVVAFAGPPMLVAAERRCESHSVAVCDTATPEPAHVDGIEPARSVAMPLVAEVRPLALSGVSASHSVGIGELGDVTADARAGHVRLQRAMTVHRIGAARQQAA